MLQYPIYGAKDKFSKWNRERQRGIETNPKKHQILHRQQYQNEVAKYIR